MECNRENEGDISTLLLCNVTTGLKKDKQELSDREVARDRDTKGTMNRSCEGQCPEDREHP